jgi:hypothetical protein
MKTARLTATRALRGLPAALLAMLACSSAFAQSADPQQPRNFDRANAANNSDPSTSTSADPDNADPNATDQAPSTDTADVPDPDADPNAVAEAAALKELRRQNLREQPVDIQSPKKIDDGLTPGIVVGTFTLRPSISQSVGMERTTTGKNTVNRTYLQTGLKGSLTSNWSRHQLTINTQGTWQKTLSGIRQDDPEGSIDAALRLDISDATKVNLKAGYTVEREDISAANAVANATDQSLVTTTTATAEITHDLGILRTTAGVDFERQSYGDAVLGNGQFASQKDRNENTVTLRGRVGYELSQAIIPFIQASYGHSVYDEHKDTLGYIRDAQLYAIKSGIEGDFGEKLRGEISTGYALAEFDDARLKAISALTLDGNATWSPQRGTDVELGLKTEIEPSTTAGASGDIAYTANAALTQDIIDTLKGRLSSSVTLRDYSLASMANQKVYDLGAGLTWGLSRSIDLNADIAWERTTQPNVPRSSVFTAGIGISLKR